MLFLSISGSGVDPLAGFKWPTSRGGEKRGENERRGRKGGENSGERGKRKEDPKVTVEPGPGPQKSLATPHNVAHRRDKAFLIPLMIVQFTDNVFIR